MKNYLPVIFCLFILGAVVGEVFYISSKPSPHYIWICNLTDSTDTHVLKDEDFSIDSMLAHRGISKSPNIYMRQVLAPYKTKHGIVLDTCYTAIINSSSHDMVFYSIPFSKHWFNRSDTVEYHPFHIGDYLTGIQDFDIFTKIPTCAFVKDDEYIHWEYIIDYADSFQLRNPSTTFKLTHKKDIHYHEGR